MTAAFFAFLVPLLLGAYYYYMGAQKDAEVAAINILRAHEELTNNHPELASEIPANKAQRVYPNGAFTPAYYRLGADALFTAESIYVLVGRHPSRLEQILMPGRVERARSWDATVIGLAELNDTFVSSYDFSCGEYDQRFIEFLKENSELFKSICPAKNNTDDTTIKNLTDAAEAQQRFHKKHKHHYLSEIAGLANYGFKQGAPEKGNPPVEISALDMIEDIKRTRYDESYYCMQSHSGKYGGVYEYFRITPYYAHPIPGSCSLPPRILPTAELKAYVNLLPTALSPLNIDQGKPVAVAVGGYSGSGLQQ